MRQSIKPVRSCYTCLLNLGDHCWAYDYPRNQWRGKNECQAFENEDIYNEYRAWQKLSTVKTRRELRRVFFKKKWKPVTKRGNRSD